ncbi:hypothetical protein TNCV_635131 [Trichonephila clavipes]|nr:hypothetical protein TNCV_635131 [Trichonephila clavipes]
MRIEEKHEVEHSFKRKECPRFETKIREKKSNGQRDQTPKESKLSISEKRITTPTTRRMRPPTTGTTFGTIQKRQAKPKFPLLPTHTQKKKKAKSLTPPSTERKIKRSRRKRGSGEEGSVSLLWTSRKSIT